MSTTQARTQATPSGHSLALLGVGLCLHGAVALRRPLDEALFSDMLVNAHRARQLGDGAADAYLAFQSLGTPLLLGALGGPDEARAYALVFLVQLAAWFAGGLAFARLCLAWCLPPAVRVAALVLYALWFPSALYTNLLLGESLGASLLLIGACAWVHEQGWRSFLGGVAIGVACLFRPNVLPLLLLLSLVKLAAAVSWRPLGLDGARLREAVPFALGGALAVGAGVSATRLLVPESAGFALSDGMNFYLSVAPVRGVEFASGQGWVPLVNFELFTEMERVDAQVTDRAYFFERSLDRIRSSPGASLARWARNVVESTGYRLQYFPGLSGFNWLLRWFALGSAGLTLVGVVEALLRRDEPVARLTLAAALASAITVAFFMGTPRARFPFDAFFLASGVAGLTSLARVLSARRSRNRAAPPSARG